MGNYAKTFSDKHRLQLIAIRLFQAQGLPLRKIRDELYGKSLEDLAEFAQQASTHGVKGQSLPVPFAPPSASESWTVVPLINEFLLVSRQNQPLPRAVIDSINQILRAASSQNQPAPAPDKN